MLAKQILPFLKSSNITGERFSHTDTSLFLMIQTDSSMSTLYDREERNDGKPKVLVITNESEIFRIKTDEGRQGRRYALLSKEEQSGHVPAEDIFGGRFTEVRNLRDKLAQIVNVDLAVITKEYGMIEGLKPIIPYSGYVSTSNDIIETEKKHRMSEKLRTMIDDYDLVVFCIPRNLLEFFIDQKLFSNRVKIVFITSRDLALRLQQDFFTILPRLGARVGHENALKIMQICRNICSKND